LNQSILLFAIKKPIIHLFFIMDYFINFKLHYFHYMKGLTKFHIIHINLIDQIHQINSTHLVKNMHHNFLLDYYNCCPPEFLIIMPFKNYF
jgi:hypothetical protein